jgi:hypothetical protein
MSIMNLHTPRQWDSVDTLVTNVSIVSAIQ